MSRVHHAVPGAPCYLAAMAVYTLVSSANLGRMQEGMHANWWTQERLLASRCADEGVPIYVYSSDTIRRAKDEKLSVIK